VRVNSFIVKHAAFPAFRQLLARFGVFPWTLMLTAVSMTAAEQGVITAIERRPASFPHRIWAACDFEWTAPDYGWFGRAETNRIPAYPGNRTALRAAPGPYQNVSAVMAGINPVPGPRMGKENGLFLRYLLQGGTRATFQHFSLTREDNWHVVVEGLTTGRWESGRVELHARRPAQRRQRSALWRRRAHG